MKLFFTKQVALSLVLSTGLALAASDTGTKGTTEAPKTADVPKTAATPPATNASKGEAPVKSETSSPTSGAPASPQAAASPSAPANTASAPAGQNSADSQAAAQVKDDLVVANVNGKKITIANLRNAYSSLPPQVQAQGQSFEKFIANPQAFRALLEREVSLEVVWQNAAKAGFDKRDDVKRKIEECQRAMVQKSYLDEKVYKSLTDEKLQPKYQELIKLMPKGKSELMLRIILTATKEEADKAAARVKKGEDFATVAKEVSIDTMTKDNGGSYGTWIREADLQQALDLTEAQIKKLMDSAKATNIFEPVKIGGRGFALFRIDDKRPMTPPTFEAIKEELRAAVAPSEAAEVIAADIKEAKIERFGIDGKPLPEIKSEEKAAPAVAPAS